MPNFEIFYMEHPTLKQDLIFKNCILYILISWNFLPTVLSNIIHVPLCFLWKDLIPLMFLSCPPRFLIRFLFWALVRSSHIMLTSFALFIRIFSTKLTNPFPGFCLTQSGTCNSLTCNFCGLEFVLVKKSIQMLILKQAYIIVIL